MIWRQCTIVTTSATRCGAHFGLLPVSHHQCKASYKSTMGSEEKEVPMSFNEIKVYAYNVCLLTCWMCGQSLIWVLKQKRSSLYICLYLLKGNTSWNVFPRHYHPILRQEPSTAWIVLMETKVKIFTDLGNHFHSICSSHRFLFPHSACAHGE